MTPGMSSSLKMATTRDGSDPWDWSVDRVVTEICTRDRSWQSAYRMPDFDTSSLEQALRRNNVNGCVLLQDVDETVMKEELGLTLLGPRGFFRDAIATLRRLSAQYQAYQQEKPLEAVTSAELGSFHDAMKRFMERFNVYNPAPAPAPDGLVPQALQLLTSLPLETVPGLRSQVLHSSNIPPPLSEETPAGDRNTAEKYLSSDTAGNKRRKLDYPDVSEGEAPRFNNVAQNEAMIESANGLPLLVAYPVIEPDEAKKRKRLAPTLITSIIDPNRNRGLPTQADTVVLSRPQINVPGVAFLGPDGRKRLMPVLVPQLGKDSKGPSNFEDRMSRPNASEHARSTVDEASSRKSSDGRSLIKQVPAAEVSAARYLGKKRFPVDELFYKGTAVGKKLAHADDTREFNEPPKKISTGHRLYVHSIMRSFLRAERQVFERDGKIFSAIRPYPERFVPKFHKPSFTLFYADDGQIHARREEVSSWPEIDSSAILKHSKNERDENKATFNPLGPDIINSYDNFDPSNLEKYLYLEGGDEILPIYGESDEENEYDLATWKEIEEEQGELDRPVKPTTKPPLSSKEINEAIDEGIAELVAKWKEKIRPKRERKAYSLWKKSRKDRTKRDQLVAAQKDLKHICERIEKMRREILDDVWTSMQQVRKQTRIMELSIFDREDLTLKIKTLELKTAPEKPAPITSVTRRKGAAKQSTGPSTGGEEGESIGSESEEISSDDSMDDFVIPDEDLPTIEEERHELNLADPEDEDGEEATMSDDSVLDTPRGLLRTPARPEISKSRKLSSEKVESDIEDYEFLSSPSANNMGTPDIKDEDQTLPKLPAATINTTSKVVDLTLLSSDDCPAREIVNLITPEKKKTKPLLRLINRNSPFRSIPISISDSNNDTIANADVMPDPENMPPYDDPAAIAKYSYKAWARSFDRERLLIKVFFTMDKGKRASIFDFIPHVAEEDLWKNMAQVIRAMIEDSGPVQGMDGSVREIITGFIRLFVMFLDGRYHPSHKIPEHGKLQKVLDNKDPLFAPFYKLCCQMEGYFDYRKQVQPSTPKGAVFGDVDEYDEDGEPLSATRRPARNTTTSEDDSLERNTPHNKRKKQIFEDTSARDLRERDRIRIAEQEKRRKVLQARLAKSGRAGDEGRGKIIINDAAAEDQGFVLVHKYIASRIKPHQIDGVRFMWNQIVTPGDAEAMQGCLLAHTMGLGKTMQVITLLVAIAEAATSVDPKISSQIPLSLKVSRTLVLCPPGLINNWSDELLTWIPDDMLAQLNPRKIDASVKLRERLESIEEWYLDGGVLVLGYEMFRKLIGNKKNKGREAASLNEGQHEQVRKHLLDGPNIIVADEAHKMKNATASITVAASRFRSKSRIALTGSPLANNIEEYHAMIEWVSPNYLGPILEFRSKYVEPIQAGLYQDSTSYERRKSLKMLGVLKEDLSPKVHRADMSVLRNDLPPKKEFVITVPLTEIQRKAYSIYVRLMTAGSAYERTKSGEVKTTTIWHWLAILSLLCNHPQCFNTKLHDRKQAAKKEISGGTDTPNSRDSSDLDIAAQLNADVWKVGVSQDLINEMTKLFKEEAPDMESIDLSFKVKILCQILDASRAANDKVLIFSQSIPTLDYLEKLCIRQHRKYARLDGSTPIPKRQDMIKEFNKGHTDIYLISTAAGGLGLNLPIANRVIIFDFKWNPIMEEQAVGRAYRIGQTKPTFVYRFVAGGTFEDTVHNKTVFKMQLASRVVDKKNPIAYASKKLSEYLFEPKGVPQKDLAEFVGMDPQVLDKVLETQSGNQIIRAIVQSDTFAIDDHDSLTAEEMKEVKQLLNDEQLKRSNPNKWLQIQSDRSRQMYNEVQRQGLALQGHYPPQMNTGSLGRPMSAAQGMKPQLPAPSVNGTTAPRPPIPQFSLQAGASIPTVNESISAGAVPVKIPADAPQPDSSVDQSQTTPAQDSKPAPSTNQHQGTAAGPHENRLFPLSRTNTSASQTQAGGHAPRRGRYHTPVAANPPRRSGSPILGANTKVMRSPSPENGKTIGHSMSAPAPSQAVKPSSNRSSREPMSRPAVTTPPIRGSSSEDPSTPEYRRKPQLARDLDALLSQAANQSRESTGLKTPTQRSDRVTQVSMAIKAILKKQTANEPAQEKAMHAVLMGLSREPAKCLALLTSELTPEAFTREILRSTLRASNTPHQDRGSSSSNGVDDITQTEMFLAMNRQPHREVQSLRIPVSNPKRGGKEKPTFESSHRLEDERELQLIQQRRQRKANRIPGWAEDNITRAQSKHRRDSRQASRRSPSRPEK